MPRFLAIFTTVITLSANGAQANNMVQQQHIVYAPSGFTVADSVNVRADWQINASDAQESFVDLVRVNYAPVSASSEKIMILEAAARHVNTHAQYGGVPAYDGAIITSNWLTKEAITKGGLLAGEEVSKGDWYKMIGATEPVTTGYGVPISSEMVPGIWTDFIADGKRSDPADAGDLLIQMAENPTFDMEGVIQTVNYGWTMETMAQTDPADAGHLLHPMLVADAGF